MLCVVCRVSFDMCLLASLSHISQDMDRVSCVLWIVSINEEQTMNEEELSENQRVLEEQIKQLEDEGFFDS